jgi:hypothetical protein
MRITAPFGDTGGTCPPRNWSLTPITASLSSKVLSGEALMLLLRDILFCRIQERSGESGTYYQIACGESPPVPGARTGLSMTFPGKMGISVEIMFI